MGNKRQRKFRNYLLDRRFQLKYTSMVVAVTVAVAGILGYFAYQFSEEQTEVLTAQLAAEPDLDPQTAADLEGFARQADRQVRNWIIVGVLVLALALGVTGILVTHRVVGPAYRMRRIFESIGDGRLEITTGIRKGDELQELYQSFADMVESLRDQRSEEIAQLEETLAKMEAAGIQSAYTLQLREVLERIRKTVD
ncbi:MAG: HAMP domain-containing protein [Polyangiales bacterium]